MVVHSQPARHGAISPGSWFKAKAMRMRPLGGWTTPSNRARVRNGTGRGWGRAGRLRNGRIGAGCGGCQLTGAAAVSLGQPTDTQAPRGRKSSPGRVTVGSARRGGRRKTMATTVSTQRGPVRGPGVGGDLWRRAGFGPRSFPQPRGWPAPAPTGLGLGPDWRALGGGGRSSRPLDPRKKRRGRGRGTQP